MSVAKHATMGEDGVKWEGQKSKLKYDTRADSKELEMEREGRPSMVPNLGTTAGFKGGRNIYAAQAAQNPIVWVGMATTVGALTFGLKAMMGGDRLLSQKMMRLRVGAQFFTVASLVGTLAYLTVKADVQADEWEAAGVMNIPQLAPLPPLPESTPKNS